jgi:hypothetical protein
MSEQRELRNEMTAAVLRAIESGGVTAFEAAVACMGAAAIVLATFAHGPTQKSQRRKNHRGPGFNRELSLYA